MERRLRWKRLSWAAAAPMIPELPGVRGDLDLSGLGMGMERVLVVGGLLAALLVIGLVVTGWFKKQHLEPLDQRWAGIRRQQLTEATRRESLRSQTVGPILALEDHERRVTPGDLRLLSRFGASSELRRVLGVFHAEVDRRLPAGTDIILCVENRGQPADESIVELDGHAAALEREPSRHGADRREWIRYAYRPEVHGHSMDLRIAFTATDGTRRVELYRTRHGFRELDRIGPAPAPEDASAPLSQPHFSRMA